MLRKRRGFVSPYKSQGGMAVAAMVVFLGAIVFAGFVYFFQIEQRSLLNREENEKERYMAEVAENLEDWYEKNSANLDLKFKADLNNLMTHESQFLSADEVLNRLEKEYPGPRKYGIQFLVSPEACTNDKTIAGNSMVCFKKLAAYIQDGRNAGTGKPSFVKGPAGATDDYVFEPNGNGLYTVVSGRDIQSKKLAATLSRMQSNAERMEVFARAKLQSDPNHDVSFNYFKAQDCARPQADEVRCTGGFKSFDSEAEIKKYGYQQMFGLGMNDMTNDWGAPIWLNNDNNGGNIRGQRYTPMQYADVHWPPFTAVYTTVTPWGFAVSVKATQLIN